MLECRMSSSCGDLKFRLIFSILLSFQFSGPLGSHSKDRMRVEVRHSLSSVRACLPVSQLSHILRGAEIAGNVKRYLLHLNRPSSFLDSTNSPFLDILGQYLLKAIFGSETTFLLQHTIATYHCNILCSHHTRTSCLSRTGETYPCTVSHDTAPVQFRCIMQRSCLGACLYACTLSWDNGEDDHSLGLAIQRRTSHKASSHTVYLFTNNAITMTEFNHLYHNRPCYCNTFPKRIGYFEPRRPRRGTITIKPVQGNIYSPARHRPSHLRFTEKLATSKEHAKRFLRFAHHPSDTQPRSAEAGVNRDTGRQKRRGSAQLESTNHENTSTENMRAGIRGSISGPVSGMVSRPSLAEDVRRASDARRVSDASASTTSLASSFPVSDAGDKPLASGSGVNVSINLAEPVLFLQGFDQGDRTSGNTAMLRGTLHLRVQKSAKIKAVTLKFKGRATTKWPEGEI